MSALRLLLLLALSLPALATAVPQQIAHQGQLYEQGSPVTGTVEIAFRLFDAATDGSEVWTDVRDVDVVDGAYSVLLGDDPVGNPLVPVLAVEPALYLEITVDGGDPLLPRQAIASVPYAVFAETAENVDGGTVNATEIQVGGSPVVDASGDWVGGAGSIDWGAVGGVPTDITDGDADTLGGLSCSDGDRAVWDGSSNLWVCEPETVDLARIDTSAATSGDFLSFDGSSALWTAVAPGGGCTLTPQGYESAELACGGTTVTVPVSPGYVDTISWQVRLRSDGTVVAFSGLLPPTVIGPFVSLGGSSSHPCALDSAGAATCWSGATLQPGPPSSGPFASIACYGDNVCCALETSGFLSCWSPDGTVTSGTLPAPSGTWQAVSVAGNQHACGLTTLGEISCWGTNNGPGLHSNRPPGGGFTLIATAGDDACASHPVTGVVCWTDDALAGSGSGVSLLTLPPGAYTELQLWNNNVYALLGTGEVVSTSFQTPWTFQTLGVQSAAVGVTTGGVAPISSATSNTAAGSREASEATRATVSSPSSPSSAARLFKRRPSMLASRYSPPIFMASLSPRSSMWKYGSALARSYRGARRTPPPPACNSE